VSINNRKPANPFVLSSTAFPLFANNKNDTVSILAANRKFILCLCFSEIALALHYTTTFSRNNHEKRARRRFPNPAPRPVFSLTKPRLTGTISGTQ
jgi:hypothetical protein